VGVHDVRPQPPELSGEPGQSPEVIGRSHSPAQTADPHHLQGRGPELEVIGLVGIDLPDQEVDIGIQIGQELGHDGRRAADIHPADDVDDAHLVEQITSFSSPARNAA
jgi:hypothetical protein